MKRYIGLVVLIAALIGLVYTIERTARAPMQRPPATAAAGQPTVPPGPPGAAMPGQPGAPDPSMPPPPGAMPGHEGHAHGPGDGHNH